ncbi:MULTISPECIES: protein-disulfide reductase DsbD domain-containing protein [unclassified Carboxylicivirga]|uniref:protein-disulfide reductase DsbD domain-containing protein n=1 Tax=Carboxylicivirga TaxID=1628153 RepID=UPI003D34D829
MIKRATFILILLASIIICHAQQTIEEPVKWNFKFEKINNWEIKVIATAEIDEGWKLYGVDIPEDGPFPTRLVIEESSANKALKKTIEVTPSSLKFDDVFEMEIPFYKEKAIFAINVRVIDSSKPIKGYVEFMCCNDEKCLPPSNIDFEFMIK